MLKTHGKLLTTLFMYIRIKNIFIARWELELLYFALYFLLDKT